LKKKIVLINPWIYDFTAFDLWARPVGLLYLAAIIKKHTENTDLYFIDCLDRFSEKVRKKLRFPKSKEDGRGKFYKEKIKKPSILKEIPRYYSRYGITEDMFKEELEKIGEADIYLVTSTMTYWYPGVHRVIEIIKRNFPKSKVWLGGIYPSLLTEFAKKHSKADLVFKGHAENSIIPLLKEAGFKVKNTPFFKNIDELPYPLFALQSKHPYLPFMTSIGCPYRCPYCATKILSPVFFQRKAENLVKELKFYKERYSIEHIVFYDDALLVNKKKRLIPMLKELKKMGLNFTFHTPNGIHIREIDKETAEIMYESNFKTIRLSLEIGVEELTDRLAPKLKLDDFEKAVKNLVDAGFSKKQLETYILFGHPLQNAKIIESSINFVSQYEVPISLSYFSPIPGTEDYKELIKKGILKENDDPLFQNKIVFVYLKSNLNSEEIKYLKELVSNHNKKIKLDKK